MLFSQERIHISIVVLVVLVVSAMGSRTLGSEETVTPTQLAQLSFEELLNVRVVTASQLPVKAKDAPASIMVITAQQIADRGYVSIEDVLQDVPGVDLVRTYGVFPVVKTFRGSYGDENKRILLMIDGIVENHVIGSFELGGPIYTLHNVERVEIIWGPGSALYGANAYSGIINIITKHGGEDDEVEYRKSFGSFDTRMEQFALNTSRKNVDISLSGTLLNSDGPKFVNRSPDYSDAYIENAFSLIGRVSYNHGDGKTTLGFHMFETPGGDGTFGATATQFFDSTGYGNMNIGNRGWVVSDINNQPGSRWYPYTRTIFLKSNVAVSPTHKLEGEVVFRETGLDESSYSYHQIAPDLFRKNLLAHSSTRLGGTLRLNWSISEKQSLIAGLQFAHDDLERGYRAFATDTTVRMVDEIPVTNMYAHLLARERTLQNNLGLFGQYVLRTDLMGATSLTLGTRYDDNSVYGSTINPRVGIVIRPISVLSFKLLYGSAFRAPTNFELYRERLPVVLANPGLKPEKVQTLEFGATFETKRFAVTVNAFTNRLTDIIADASVIITGASGQVDTATQLQNTAEAHIHGLEIISNFVVGGGIEGFANLSLQTGHQNDGGGNYDVPNVAKFRSNLGLIASVGDFARLSLTGNWVGDRSVAMTNPLGKVGGYKTAHLGLRTTKRLHDHFSINVTINNLFDTQFLDPGIRSAEGHGYNATVHEQPGRHSLLTISYSL